MKVSSATAHEDLIQRLDNALSFGTTGRDALPNLLKDCKAALEGQRYADLEHEHLGCPTAKTGIYADRTVSASALKDFADAVEKIAFEMPAPNPYTPRLVQLAVTARSLDTRSQSRPSESGKWCDSTQRFDCINSAPGDCIGEGRCLRLRDNHAFTRSSTEVIHPLAAACEKLLEYRRRNQRNFQLEKADDHFRSIRIELDLLGTRSATEEHKK